MMWYSMLQMIEEVEERFTEDQIAKILETITTILSDTANEELMDTHDSQEH